MQYYTSQYQNLTVENSKQWDGGGRKEHWGLFGKTGSALQSKHYIQKAVVTGQYTSVTKHLHTFILQPLFCHSFIYVGL